MALARFPFSKQKSEAFGYVARPVITVTLRARSGEYFDITALLDSGADVSMFSPSVAKILGVKITTGKRRMFRGLGGGVEAYVHRIPFKIASLRFRARVAFPMKEIPNIVGRLDVMKNTNVLFEDERRFSIRPPRGG